MLALVEGCKYKAQFFVSVMKSRFVLEPAAGPADDDDGPGARRRRRCEAHGRVAHVQPLDGVRVLRTLAARLPWFLLK